MAKNTYLVTEAKPLLRVRHARNRNQSRLTKRLNRISASGETVTVTLPNGTLEVHDPSDVAQYTVKRDAERAAKKSGGRLRTLTSE